MTLFLCHIINRKNKHEKNLKNLICHKINTIKSPKFELKFECNKNDKIINKI